MASGHQLVRAEGVLRDRILDLTHPLWSDGLTRQRYAQYNEAQMRTPWGSRHLARLALVDGGEVLASLKRYDLMVLLDGQAVPAVGIGAVFTPPGHRGHGYGRRIVNDVLDRARDEGFALALLFSEIGTSYYERLGFARVPLVPTELIVRARAGAPAVPMRTGDESDLPLIADIHAHRAAGYRLSLHYDRDWLQYSIVKRRLLAGLGPPGMRQFEFAVAEEGGRPVAWVMLQAERTIATAGETPERWTIESCGDRDPSGARVGALLQALVARTPAAPPAQIVAWWPEGFDPPQIDRRRLTTTPVVMMARPLAAGTPVAAFAAGDVLYWHLDAF